MHLSQRFGFLSFSPTYLACFAEETKSCCLLNLHRCSIMADCEHFALPCHTPVNVFQFTRVWAEHLACLHQLLYHIDATMAARSGGVVSVSTNHQCHGLHGDSWGWQSSTRHFLQVYTSVRKWRPVKLEQWTCHPHTAREWVWRHSQWGMFKHCELIELWRHTVW